MFNGNLAWDMRESIVLRRVGRTVRHKFAKLARCKPRVGSTPALSAYSKLLPQKCLWCKRLFQPKYRIQKFCSEVCANRHNVPTLKKVSLPSHSTRLAELVGIVLGDGSLTKYQLGIYLNKIVDSKYVPLVANLIVKLFPEVKVNYGYFTARGDVRLYVNSIQVVNFFKEMGIVSGKPKVPDWIFLKNEYKIACLRGLVDTEGCIGFKSYYGKKFISLYRQLTFTSLNIILLNFVVETLNELGFKCTQSRIKNIYLSNDEEIDKYRKLIRFHNPKLEEKSLLRSYNTYIEWKKVRCRRGLSGWS